MWERTEHMLLHFVFDYNDGLLQVLDFANTATVTTTTTTTIIIIIIEIPDCYAA
jgi:Na+-transporting NADH:ubiquinone oxidoreductase subunit NqrD